MKKYILIIMFVIALCLVGCNIEISNKEYQPQEQPHLYWKDIDVIITNIDKRHFFVKAHWYVITLTVESKEYGLTENFEIRKIGVASKEWNYKEGQTVKAQLYSWVMDSTGEVTRRKINKIY